MLAFRLMTMTDETLEQRVFGRLLLEHKRAYKFCLKGSCIFSVIKLAIFLSFNFLFDKFKRVLIIGCV
jgi:hypothetical protein